MRKCYLALPVLLLMACNSTKTPVNLETAVAETSVTPVTYANTITEEELKELLYTFASDEFEGRETGQPGQKKAVNFLRKFYQDQGIAAARSNGDYFQKVPLEISGAPSGTITIGTNTFNIGTDVVTYSTPTSGSSEIVFAGYGIETADYSDYTNIDVKGKYVLIKNGEPRKEDGTYLLTGSKEPGIWSNWRETLSDRSVIALNKGAIGILYYDQEYFNRSVRRYEWISRSDHGGSISIKKDTPELTFITLGESAATKIMSTINTAHKAELLSDKIMLNFDNNSKEVDSENVVAFIKGSEKPDEYLVISSHLDHIGISPDGQINNGADDDGSGSVSLLEIAEAFQTAVKAGHGPKRSIVFLHVTGEEKGLLGSEYYSEHPVFPMEQTVANLNIDMIGRIDPKRTGDRNYIYLIGSDKLSTELHDLSEEINKKYCNIELDYKYNDENDPNRFYYRSDHYHFAKNNVPIIFYFNGTHDDYHRPSDTPDKINYDLMENRARLVFYTAWEVANREKRITADKAL